MNIVVTGASRGLGRAIAEAFAADGHTLFLCARGAGDLRAAAADIGGIYAGSTIRTMPADLSDRSGVLAFAQWVLAGCGAPDVLVNNTGRYTPGDVGTEPEGALEDMIATNLYSAYHLTRALLPGMIGRGTGHIFNICSIASLQAYPGGGAYSISKFALLGFSRNLRAELKPHGIKVTAVCPGAAYTASWEGSGVDPNRIMHAADVGRMVYAAAQLSPQATVEDIVMRPQKGDI